jgi:twitching motility protein PilT
VVSQLLLPRAGGPGRALALEVMVPNPAIRNLIREDKIHQIYSQMQIGQAKFGMQTLNQSLTDLFLRQLITLEDGFAASSDHDELKQMIASAQGGGPAGRAGQAPPRRA